MNVADLFASFGFDTDFESIAKVHSAIAQVEQHAKQAADAARLAGALEHVTGNTAKASALIGFADGAAEKAMAGATKGAFDWHRAILTVNQALGIATKILGGIQRGIGFVRGLVGATEAQAAQAVELAQRFGITAEAVQELGFAASQSGADIETLTIGLGGLSDKLDAAKKGGKDAAASLKAVGVNIADVRSGKQSLDGTLGQIAEKFAAMPDGATKSALAVDLFGKSGRKLIPLLNEGSAGIDALRQQARDLGIVIDNDTAAALENFGDQTEALHAQLGGLRNQAIAAILPTLKEMIAGLQEWIKANRQMLVDALTGALRGFLAVLKGVAIVLAGVAQVVAFFNEHGTAAIALLGALAAAFTYMGIAAAIAWLEVAWPIPLIALAVAGLILLFPYLAKAFDVAAKGIAHALEWVAGRFKALGRGVEGIFRSIGNFFAGIGRGIRDGFETAINWVVDKMNWAIRQFNRIPILGDFGEIGHVGGGGQTAAASRATVAGSKTASAATINDNRQVAVNINAGNANAEQVGPIVKDVLDQHFRAAYDGIG